MKETTLFKWTREDGKYVILENGKLSAHNADDTVINPEADEAVDLFVEASMIMRSEMPLATFNDDEDEDYKIRRNLDIQMDHLMVPGRHIGMNHHHFMNECMFGWGDFMMFGCHRRRHTCHWVDSEDNNEDLSDREFAYKSRKAMMEDFREERREQNEREARRKREIIATATPYEAPAVCPDELIADNNQYHLKENGSTIITVGHDTENRSLYNVIDTEHNFIFPEHKLRINRINKDCFCITDKDDIDSLYNIKTKQIIFSAPAGKRIHEEYKKAFYYETDNNTIVCYDYDGNKVAEFTSEWELRDMIGGRPVVGRNLTDEEREKLPVCRSYLYNLILPDGSLMFKDWQFEIQRVGYPNRFSAITQDGICSIYSTEDGGLIYRSERPRRIKPQDWRTDETRNLFILIQTSDFHDCEDGIIVNVETGEVISKDADGNPKDYEKIDYPNPYHHGKHWRAMLSVKTKRMESIDPLTGKRIRNKSNK